MGGRLVRLLAVVGALVVGGPAPAEASPPSVADEIAAGWRADRLYVDPALRPGFPAAELTRIRSEARKAGLAVYVALVPRTPALVQERFDLPTLLQARTGQPGLYVVSVVSDDYWSATAELFRPAGLRGRGLTSVQSEDEEDRYLVRDRPAPAIVRTIQQAATAYDGRPLPPVPATDLDPPSVRSGRSVTDKENLSAYTGMGVGGVLGFVLTLVPVLRRRARAAGKPTASRERTDRGDDALTAETARSQADRWIGKAERALRQLETRKHRTVELLDRRDDAVRRLDAARSLRDSQPDDVLALAGASVLARQAQQSAAGEKVLPPCFFDPTHPAASAQAAWSDETEVPACRNCARLVERGRTPHGLRVRRRSGLLGLDRDAVPYWTLDPAASPVVATGFGALSDDLPERVLGSIEDAR